MCHLLLLFGMSEVRLFNHSISEQINTFISVDTKPTDFLPYIAACVEKRYDNYVQHRNLTICFELAQHIACFTGWWLDIKLESDWRKHDKYSVSHSLPNSVPVRQEAGRLAGWLADHYSMSQQLGALQTHTTDTFHFISHTTNVLLFKFRCNIFIGVRTIKEMAGSVASGTSCITPLFLTQRTQTCSNFVAISSLVLELLKKYRFR